MRELWRGWLELRYKGLKGSFMIRIFGFLIAMGFATGVAGQECAFFCEEYYAEDYFYQDFTLVNVTNLLADGADIEERDGNGNTPLMVATYLGKPEIVQLLLEAGADVTAVNRIGATLLHLVMIEPAINRSKISKGLATNPSTDYLNIFHTLLGEGLDLNAATTNMEATPLIFAAYTGAGWGVLALLEAGADAGITIEGGRTAFDIVGDNPDLIGAEAYLALEAASAN